MTRPAFLLAVLAMGCATTQIQSSWKDPSADTIHFQKVVVFALAKDPSTRRIAEDELVRDSPSGTMVASHTFVSDAELGDVPAVKQKVKAQGFDGAVVMRPVGTQTRQTVVPGAPMQPFGAPYSSLWGYYGYGYPGAYMPDTVRTDRYVEIETLVVFGSGREASLGRAERDHEPELGQRARGRRGEGGTSGPAQAGPDSLAQAACSVPQDRRAESVDSARTQETSS